jgi:HAD superfamily hydrolase (TIGR01490 family)
MEYRKLGNSDLVVSEISLGSWLTYGVGVERETAETCLNRAFDLGINFLDTANAYGRGRARSLGWPDAYGLTKALTEMAMAETRGEMPVQIVRPSIIESALAHPYPGWIEGFRVADPVILAYGRGVLPDFPGVPEGLFDVIPVDLVVNAILAVAAAASPPAVVHVSTGSRNPMRYRELVRYVHEYFQREPYRDEDGQPIFPEMWKFPGKDKVMSRLKWGRRAFKAASRVADHLPRSRFEDAARRVESRLEELEQAEKYAELYGAYAEVQTVFDDANARALHESLSPVDREQFGFDPTDFDWRTYLQELHLPEVTRRRGVVRRRARTSPVSSVEAGKGAGAVLAVFDLEGTVLGTNVVDTYLWIRLAASPRSEWARRMADLAVKVPGYLLTDRRDRGQFLRNFYRRYEDAPAAELATLGREAFDSFVLPRCFPEAMRRIRDHKAAGHTVVFLTGALDFTVAAMQPLADEIKAARLEIVDGRYTGDLVEVPLAGDARASYLRSVADRYGADLRSSYAYGDSISDLPMLQSVGRPVVVNPDSRLARIARHRRWPIEQWSTEKGSPRFRFPELVQ